MNQEGEGWNVNLLKSLVTESEANAIMNIPLSSMGVQDRLIWDHTANGQLIFCQNRLFGGKTTPKTDQGGWRVKHKERWWWGKNVEKSMETEGQEEGPTFVMEGLPWSTTSGF